MDMMSQKNKFYIFSYYFGKNCLILIISAEMLHGKHAIKMPYPPTSTDLCYTTLQY